jgi:hypothetical protein
MNEPPPTPGPESGPEPSQEALLREALVRFARRILTMEEEGRLLASPGDLQVVLGELRRRLFEWEVRQATGIRDARREAGGAGGAGDDGDRVVAEAREAEEALRRLLEEDDER